jgi:hypothetical protein
LRPITLRGYTDRRRKAAEMHPQFRRSAEPTGPTAGGLVLALALLVGCSDAPNRSEGPAMHDHGAHHGGVVAMAGPLHVEAIVLPDGTVRVYPSDLRRQAIAATEITGSVSVESGAVTRTEPLVAAGERLEAKVAPLAVDHVVLHLSLRHGTRSSLLHLRVPVGASELAGLPRMCQPVEGSHAPRCVVRFPRMIRMIAVTRDGGTALIAVFAHGVTAWRLPAGELVLGLSPVPGADEHPDHAHPVDALAIRPDGAEVAVSATARLLRYELGSGAQTADLPGAAYRIRGLAWSADGTRLFASTFHDGVVRVLRPRDAIESSRLTIDGHLVAFATSPSGDVAVLASEEGPLTVVDVASGEVRRRMPSPVAAPLLTFAGRYLVAGREDGAVDVWDPNSGARMGGTGKGPRPLALAVRPGDGLVASAGDDGAIRLHALPGGEPRDTLRWHDRPVQALAFAGPVLLSGDSAGALALWDLPERRSAGKQSFTAAQPVD